MHFISEFQTSRNRFHNVNTIHTYLTYNAYDTENFRNKNIKSHINLHKYVLSEIEIHNSCKTTNTYRQHG